MATKKAEPEPVQAPEAEETHIAGLPEMPRGIRSMMTKVSGRDYLPVAARVLWFRRDHPDWRILTAPLDGTFAAGYAVMRCEIQNADGITLATATKSENKQGFGDFIEKAEAGAVGRALGFLGYSTANTDDLDEGRVCDTPQSPRPQNYQSQASPGTQHGNGGGLADTPGSLSDPQKKAIFAISRKLGMNETKIQICISSAYKVERVDDLSKAQATRFIDQLKKWEAEREQSQGAPADDDVPDYGDPLADSPDATPALF